MMNNDYDHGTVANRPHNHKQRIRWVVPQELPKMTMIIADLEEDNHQYLTAYKLKNGYRTIPKALNAWMKETRGKNQLFR